jgi:hypothetical protein
MRKSGISLSVVVLILLTMSTGAAWSGLSQSILVDSGAVWRYLDDGSDQDTPWRHSGFNDSLWAAGPAQLGYGDGDEATVVSYGPDPNSKYVTYYFRHSFLVDDPSQHPGLLLRLLRDDGAVIYLNGEEIERSNMPTGTIDYLTLASSTVSAGDEDAFFESFEDPANLVAGTNLIAVEVHQRSVTSSDISFDLQLLSAPESVAVMRKSPYLIYTGHNTEMQVLWQLHATDTCLISWGVDTTYSSGSALSYEYGDDHQHAYSISDLTPGTDYYYRVAVKDEAYTGSFRAAPVGDVTALKFMAYGDTRSYPESHEPVAAAMVATGDADEGFRSLIVSMGDLVNHGDIESDWDRQFFDPSYPGIQKLLASFPYQSCIGNHEQSGVLFTKYFPYPFVAGRYWSFDFGPAHFVVVDQYTDYGPGSAQLAWIETDLASTDKVWKFVYLHEPGWSAGHHPNNTTVQDVIQPLCEAHDVAIVFAGHNHYYARAVVNGVHHVTTGGGGAPLYAPNLGFPNVVAASRAYHFCKVEIEGSLLTFSAVTPDGTEIDDFSVAVQVEDERSGAVLPDSPQLHQNCPNPFSRATRIEYELPEESHVALKIYNVGGQLLETLVDRVQKPGSYGLEWFGDGTEATNNENGVYFCNIRMKEFSSTKKMVLLR